MNKELVTPSTSELITLRGGFQIPLPALQLAWDLEARGIVLLIDGDVLVARPGSGVSHEEATELRRYRSELIRLVEYCGSTRM